MPFPTLRRLGLGVFLSAFALSSSAAGQQSTAGDRYVGTWQGTLQTPGPTLRLMLAVERDASGGLAGALTSVDQGNARIPGTFATRNDSLVVAMAAANATLAAMVNTAGDTLRGAFVQGTLSMPVVLVKATGTAPVRPQEPKAPFPYSSTDVVFDSDPGVHLAGTLTVPAGKGPFPAVALITGSGPEDRDEALMGHKPFYVLADYLSRHGIAVLRYDDRGVAKSTGKYAGSTIADFANDAEAAVRFLDGRPEVARNKVGLIGHSEGGVVAPMVASRSPKVAFIVLMAGPALPGDSLLILQTRASAFLAGATLEDANIGSRVNRKLYGAVTTAHDPASVRANLTRAVDEIVATVPPDQQAAVRARLASASAGLLDPGLGYFLSYDPRPTLSKVRVPVLALNGTLDFQVPYKENLAEIEAALKAGKNKHYEVMPLEKLNHLFQTARTGADSEYSQIEETIAPVALAKITTWITKVTAQ